MPPFGQIKIRVAALIFCGSKILLLRRCKDDIETYTVPGGNIADGEDITNALQRELQEELALDLAALGIDPVCVAVQDQMVSRPGNTPPPRKLHVIFKVEISKDSASALAIGETDEIGTSMAVWVERSVAAACHLYPAVNVLLGCDAPTVLLPAMTDNNFSWR